MESKGIKVQSFHTFHLSRRHCPLAFWGLMPSPSQPHIAQLLKITSKVPANLPPGSFPAFNTPDSNYIFILHHSSFKRCIHLRILQGPSMKSSPESEVHFPFPSMPRVLGFYSCHLVMQASYYVSCMFPLCTAAPSKASFLASFCLSL